MNTSSIVEYEFERESHRIDQLIWDAMALRAGETVLFCGLSNNLDWIKRAAGLDVAVSVISNDAEAMRNFDGLPVAIIRGSTSMLPARDASFDATVAFHYLHEIDPFFHSNAVSELARVGKRCIIVEPAPPSDPLGLRIASLYSRAKRELGEFEQYHYVDYWRKLLAIVKADVNVQTFTFLRTPPAQAVQETVSLIIDTMAVEDTPAAYIAELRALAARSDAKLLPQARYVIVGTSAGQLAPTASGTDFRDQITPELRPALAVKPFVPPVVTKSLSRLVPTAPATSTVYSSAEIEPEFPAMFAPPTASVAQTQPLISTSQIARNAFGLAAAAETVAAVETGALEFAGAQPAEDDPFGVPTLPGAALPAETGWAWEPPDAET